MKWFSARKVEFPGGFPSGCHQWSCLASPYLSKALKLSRDSVGSSPALGNPEWQCIHFLEGWHVAPLLHLRSHDLCAFFWHWASCRCQGLHALPEHHNRALIKWTTVQPPQKLTKTSSTLPTLVHDPSGCDRQHRYVVTFNSDNADIRCQKVHCWCREYCCLTHQLELWFSQALQRLPQLITLPGKAFSEELCLECRKDAVDARENSTNAFLAEISSAKSHCLCWKE